MIEHYVETGVGERQIHEVPVTKLNQMTDPSLLRQFCSYGDMRLTIGQSCDVHSVRFGQVDRRTSNAAAGVQTMRSRFKVASSCQHAISPQQGLAVGLSVRAPEAEMARQQTLVRNNHRCRYRRVERWDRKFRLRLLGGFVRSVAGHASG